MRDLKSQHAIALAEERHGVTTVAPRPSRAERLFDEDALDLRRSIWAELSGTFLMVTTGLMLSLLLFPVAFLLAVLFVPVQDISWVMGLLGGMSLLGIPVLLLYIAVYIWHDSTR